MKKYHATTWYGLAPHYKNTIQNVTDASDGNELSEKTKELSNYLGSSKVNRTLKTTKSELN